MPYFIEKDASRPSTDFKAYANESGKLICGTGVIKTSVQPANKVYTTGNVTYDGPHSLVLEFGMVGAPKPAGDIYRDMIQLGLTMPSQQRAVNTAYRWQYGQDIPDAVPTPLPPPDFDGSKPHKQTAKGWVDYYGNPVKP